MHMYLNKALSYHSYATKRNMRKTLVSFLFGRKMLKFNTEFLALEMSTFQVSDVQEKSSRLEIKTNPGLRVSGSTAKDNDNYSYFHVTTPLYRHRNDPHHRNDPRHRNDPQSPPK